MNIPAAAGQTGDLSRADTRACLAAADAHVGLLALQETSEVEDNEDIDAVLSPATHYHFQPDSENDIVVKRSRWAPLINSAGVERTHRIHLSPGLAGVTPERNLTDVYLQWVDRPTWTPFTFGGSHLVSGVYAGNDHLADRQRDRDLEFAGIQAWVLQRHAAGVVIFSADTNWADMPKLHPDWVWAIDDGIDKVGFLNSPASNWELSFVSAERYANPSDHDFRVANLLATAVATSPSPSPLTP